MRLAQGQVRHFMADRSRFVGELLKAKDTDKTHRMLKALWQMEKLDIKRLKAAFEGRE